MDRSDQHISKIDQNLAARNFTLWRNISIKDDLDTDLFASRIRWMVARNSEHVFVQYKVSPSRGDFEQLLDDGLEYAKRAYPTALPLLPWTNYKIIACIATVNASNGLIHYATQRPQWSWTKNIVHGYFPLPVLLDLNTGIAHCYPGFFSRSMQQIVRECIIP